MKVLLTGFDPFGGESVNPAFEAIKLLPDTIAGAEIVKVEIPTEFTRSISCVEAAIKEHNPDVVIDVGQAGGRACVTVEKVGINLADARIPDNAGEQPARPHTLQRFRSKQWFRTSANTAFRATYPSPQAPTYATASCTMCFTCAQRNIRTSAQASSTYRSHASR